jgi:hypothetical protein
MGSPNELRLPFSGLTFVPSSNKESSDTAALGKREDMSLERNP